MDFLFIAYLLLLLLCLLIRLSCYASMQRPCNNLSLDNLLDDIDYALKSINWYPITDYRQYVVLVIGITLGYLLGLD